MEEEVKRSEVIGVRFTSYEAHLGRAVAAAEGKTISELMRDLLAERVAQRFRRESLARGAIER